MSCLALPWLYDAVVARFELEHTQGINYFGWRKSAQQSEDHHRIVWIPGDDENGNVGNLSDPIRPGPRADGGPRPLATLEELCTVKISSVNLEDPEDERLQYEATRLLFDAWYRAVRLAMPGNHRVLGTKWIGRVERDYGKTLRCLIAVKAVIPDTAPTRAPVDVGSDTTVRALDHSEHVITPLET